MSQRLGARILVVEDDDSFRRAVTHMLERSGYHAVAVRDFAAAIEVIESRERLDLLLTDIGLPAGTPHGLAVAQMARSRRPDLKVIYMSGTYDTSEIAAFADDARILQKPFLRSTLIESLEAALAATR